MTSNVPILVLVLTIHALIHASASAVAMPFAKQNDIWPFANAHRDSAVMHWYRAVNRVAIQWLDITRDR